MTFVKPAKIQGRIDVPPSKSMMLRAVFAGSLAKGSTEILRPSYCADALAAIDIAKALGAELDKEDKKLVISGGAKPRSFEINCGESGLAVRMLCAVAALHNEEFVISGAGSLLKRPLSMLIEPLVSQGVQVRTENELLPITIKGPLRGGELLVDGSLSQQFISGLLMALPLCENDSTLLVKNLKSKPYVLMTLELLEDFGIQVKSDNQLTRFDIKGRQEYQARSYTVEGDWSGASCILVAGAVAGTLELCGLRADSLQADRVMLDALKKAGAIVTVDNDVVRVSKGTLQAFDFDATDCPDLFPALVALASNCEGLSKLKGANRLIHKESNRAQALLEEFGKLGAELRVKDDLIEVVGQDLVGGEVHSHGDHRIAMACAVAALNSQAGVSIDKAEAVSKSYPEFFSDLEKVMVSL